MGSPKVYVVDDDDAVRDALTRLLTVEDYDVEAFPSAEAFLSGYDPGTTSCLLLDVRMPGMDGLELQQLLVQRGIGVPIVFLTSHGDVPMSSTAFRSGAVDVLEKPVDDERLFEIVREALEHAERYHAERARRAPAEARVASLTGREREVASLLVAGQTNKQIARTLDISPRTVETHRARIMDKSGVDSLPALAELARLGGLEREG